MALRLSLAIENAWRVTELQYFQTRDSWRHWLWCDLLFGVRLRRKKLRADVCIQFAAKQKHAYKTIVAHHTEINSARDKQARTKKSVTRMCCKLTAVGFEPTPLRTGA
jgi:hypothetical protein